MNCRVQKSAAGCYPEWRNLKIHTHLFLLLKCLFVNKHSKTIHFLNYTQIFAPYRAVNTLRVLVIKSTQLMLNREIIVVCSEFQPKHINTAVCGQNVEFLIFAISKCVTHI